MADNKTITAADAVLTLSVLLLFPTPQQIQGFANDDAFSIPQFKSVATLRGTDGKLSGGYIFSDILQKIVLQADSLSNDFFDVWWTNMQSSSGVFPANGLIQLPGIATKFTLTRGFLTGYVPLPPVKSILHPREYEISWETVFPSPG